MPPPQPQGLTLGSFLPASLKPEPEPAQQQQQQPQQPRPIRCRCEGPYDLCFRCPITAAPNAACKPTWERVLKPFAVKGREWTIVELRGLWPHTIQALNERLMKGRMERTLKEDLQDDVQVLVDLIQYSCKPHPRPPRAGMKTLIVQGRILAEAIAQDALFQLDPAGCAAAASRPDRDLVDLINRLRDQHPHSLLAPALHVLRTLGNTAVHLDRESQRLTDAEIGDAAAICCRFVVLVIDAYMQMCANLHKHDETEEALAQPLQDAPVAPIPAPNVLTRPRDTEQPPPASSAPAAASPLPGGATTAASPAVPATFSRTNSSSRAAANAASNDHQPSAAEDEVVYTPGMNGITVYRRRSSSSGHAAVTLMPGPPATRGSQDGSRDASRVPYSLVPSDWAPHLQAQVGQGTSPGFAAHGSYLFRGGSGDHSAHNDAAGGGDETGSRGWWPAIAPGEAAALAAVPLPAASALLPPTLLRRSAGPEAGAGAAPWALHDQREGSGLAEETGTDSSFRFALGSGQQYPYPTDHQPSAAAAYGLPAHPHASAPSLHPYAAAPYQPNLSGAGTNTSSVPTGTGTANTPPPPLGLYRPPRASSPPPTWTLPGPPSPALGVTTASHNPTGTNSSTSGGVSGGSPRRSPITLTGAGGMPPPLQPLPAAALPLGGLRGASPPPQTRQGQQPSIGELGQGQAGAAGQGQGGGGGGGGSSPAMSAGEASKRLLQLCATATSPPPAKVLQLLQAGASVAVTDKSGMTPLHLAAYWCHTHVAQLLLDRCTAAGPGAQGGGGAVAAAVSAADREGRRPLWVACQRGHGEVVELLLQAGAGVDEANAAGVTPLRVASAQGHVSVVAALLAAGADPNAADKDGYSPLYVACARSHLEVTQQLLAAGARVDSPDKAFRTPLWAALHPGGSAKAEASPERRTAVVRALLAAGADVHLLQDVRDRDYCWALLAQAIAAGE